MQVNKYLRNIIQRESDGEPQATLQNLQARKQRDLMTYLTLVGRRLLGPPSAPASALTSSPQGSNGRCE